MPIRFQCPECQSKLKIGSHKVGSTKACPFCQAPLLIPEGREDQVVMARRAVHPADAHMPQPPATHRDGSLAYDPLSVESRVSPSSEIRERLAGRPATASLVVWPRSRVYVLGGLLLVVAVVSFLLGLLTGQSLRPTVSPAALPRQGPAIVEGAVFDLVNNERVPDEGSLVILVPSDVDPEVRPQPEGLHPIQGAGAGGPDAQLIRSWGGEVVRVGPAGEFRVELVAGRRYDGLVISAQIERSVPITRELRATWGRVFVPVEAVVGAQAWTMFSLTPEENRQVLPALVIEEAS